MWIDLGRGILEEFAAVRGDFHHYDRRDFAYRLRVVLPKEPRDRWERAREMARKHARLMRVRLRIAAGRPPCPVCGGPVERLGTTGTLPKYCAAKCMRKAKRDAFNARRRP